MRKIVFISLLLICAIEIGCNNSIGKEEARNKLQKVLKIKISDNFRIADYENSYSTTSDFSESFTVKFNKEEFDDIFKKINPSKVKTDTTLYYIQTKNVNEVFSLTFEPATQRIYYTYIYE